MKSYQDRLDTEVYKTKDVSRALGTKKKGSRFLTSVPYFKDDGVFVYCICLSDIYKNILYSPYELRIVSKEQAVNSDVFFTVSGSCIVRVR